MTIKIKWHKRKRSDVPEEGPHARYHGRWNNDEDQILYDIIDRQPTTTAYALANRAMNELRNRGYNRTVCAVEGRLKRLLVIKRKVVL